MPRGKKDGKTKKSGGVYFGIEEENAVKEYLSIGNLVVDETTVDGFKWVGTPEDYKKRNEIYKTYLKAPLNKMIESIIRTYKLYPKNMEFDDLHSDTLSFLMIKFHKFKPEINKKAYSYYGTICKNYLLGKLLKDNKKLKSSVSFEEVSSLLQEDEEYSYVIDDHQEIDLLSLIKNVSNSVKKELSERLLSENEIKVGNALVSILDNWETIFIKEAGNNKYNKNLILLYMREMTSLNTKDIRNSMKRYKSIYKLIKDQNL